jgi:hypothetical protein
MEQIPTWEANSSSATQKLHRILWKPKIYYRVPVSILSQIDPYHLSHFLTIHFNNIPQSLAGLSTQNMMKVLWNVILVWSAAKQHASH